MTGTVEWSTLLWVVGLVLGVAGGTFAIGWQVLSWVTGEFTKRDRALETAEASIHLRIEAVDARAKTEETVIAKSLYDHKLYASESFATKAGLTEALNRVHDALDKLSDRIDALISQNRNGSPGGKP